ncbi:MAG: hypothetical protein ACOX4F_02460 [Atopobiaceae bacterium]|jgi:hypothetical protein
MKDQIKRAQLEGYLARERDAIAAGRLTEALTLTLLVSDLRDQATPVELVDLLERACVFGPKLLVDFMYDVLAPFVYEGWALALALRVAREDVAEDLLDRGVDLLQDVERLEVLRSIAAHETSLSRFDLTRTSPNLFLNMQDTTVSSEVFAPFTGNEQLVGGSFSTAVDLKKTVILVGRLAEEGRFESVVFDDLFRAAIVRGAGAYKAPDTDTHAAEVAKLCLALASRMMKLHEEKGYGSEYMSLILASFMHPDADPRIMIFVSKCSPSTFLEALSSYSWLRHRPDLVERAVPYLAAGTEEQNARIVELLAKHGKLGALKRMADLSAWQGCFTHSVLQRGIDAASGAGHAEVATWLLSLHEDGSQGNATDSLNDLMF